MDVGKRLLELRNRCWLTQNGLADKAGVSQTHLRRVELGQADITVGHHTWLTMEQDGVNRDDVCDTMAEFRNAIIKAEGGKLYGSDIFYVESCVYLMTLYDLVTSGHKVWQVYDCFYATGDEDQELFEFMISNGVKRNFEDFLSVWWKE